MSYLNTSDWQNEVLREAWEEAQVLMEREKQFDSFSNFQNDPIGFGEQILNDFYTDDIKKVMQSVVDNPITIVRSANGPGKSHGAARVALWFYKVFGTSKVYLTAAPPLENLKRILWGEVLSTIDAHEELFKTDHRRALSISRGAQSFIQCVTIPTSGTEEQREAKFSGKHAPYMLFVVDEGDAVPEEVYRGIEGCMSGGMARLLIMFNPRMSSGYLYRLERDGRANVIHISALNHPNVITGETIIPGAVSREITIRRINEWTREYAPDEKIDELNTFYIPKFLVGKQARALSGQFYQPLGDQPRKITDPAFWYMVLGEYPTQSEQQLISDQWIANARSRYDLYIAKYGETPPVGVRPILGVDVAEYGTDSNAACLRYGGFVPPIKTWGGVDTDLSATIALKYYKDNNCIIAMIDGTGVGTGIAPAMARQGRNDDVRAISVKIASSPSTTIRTEMGEFYQLRDQLLWAVRDWLEKDPGAMLPPDQKLIEELRVVKYATTLTGKIKMITKDEMRSLLKRSPDRADALCLTFMPVERPKIIRLS